MDSSGLSRESRRAEMNRLRESIAARERSESRSPSRRSHHPSPSPTIRYRSPGPNYVREQSSRGTISFSHPSDFDGGSFRSVTPLGASPRGRSPLQHFDNPNPSRGWEQRAVTPNSGRASTRASQLSLSTEHPNALNGSNTSSYLAVPGLHQVSASTVYKDLESYRRDPTVSITPQRAEKWVPLPGTQAPPGSANLNDDIPRIVSRLPSARIVTSPLTFVPGRHGPAEPEISANNDQVEDLRQREAALQRALEAERARADELERRLSQQAQKGPPSQTTSPGPKISPSRLNTLVEENKRLHEQLTSMSERLASFAGDVASWCTSDGLVEDLVKIQKQHFTTDNGVTTKPAPSSRATFAPAPTSRPPPPAAPLPPTPDTKPPSPQREAEGRSAPPQFPTNSASKLASPPRPAATIARAGQRSSTRGVPSVEDGGSSAWFQSQRVGLDTSLARFRDKAEVTQEL